MEIYEKQLKIACLTALPVHFLLYLTTIFHLFGEKQNIFQPENIRMRLFFETTYEIVISLVLIILLRKFLNNSWSIFKSHLNTNIKHILFSLLSAFAVVFTWNFIEYLLTSYSYRITNVNDTILYCYFSISPLLYVILSIFIAPFTEECLYRGVIYALFNKINNYVAIVGTAILFTFIHLIPTLANSDIKLISIFFLAMNYLSLGFCFTLIYKKFNNIWINIGVHMLWNLFCLLISLFR